MASGDPLLETQGLSRVYKMGRSEVHALRGVDLVVPRGQFLAIMGRSGSGKSTLLNLIGGLDRPTSGTIMLDGQELTKLSKARLTTMRREKVGFVFQQFNLIPTLTALENVMLPLRYAGLGGGERRQRAQELLAMVGVAERLSHRPTELSGGEQQRVAIARALANHPTLILADEPTGELDTTTAQEIMDLLWELNREMGQTVIIVTHDPQIAGATQRIIYFRDGAIEREERPES